MRKQGLGVNFALGLVVVTNLSACTTIPNAPSILALPGTGRSFEQFQRDDADCRAFALGQNGGASANQQATQSGVQSAAVGAVVGAVAGAALGGNRAGAGVGAGAGLAMGALAGSEASRESGSLTQRSYDNAYVQCMYAKGHKVPVPASLANSYPNSVVSSANNTGANSSTTNTTVTTASTPTLPPAGIQPAPPAAWRK